MANHGHFLKTCVKCLAPNVAHRRFRSRGKDRVRGSCKACESAAASVRRTNHRALPEYRSWAAMKQRCSNPKSAGYLRYGGRGIRVCKRWETFANFLEDMGTRPTPEHSLDREDNDGDYEPRNCRWATPAEQSRNRRNSHHLTFDGVTLNVKDWSRKLGMANQTLYARINVLGWSVEDALTTPAGAARTRDPERLVFDSG